MRTPQVKPDWAAGIYIGNGTIALGDGKVTLDNEGVVAPPVSYAPMFNFGDTETKGNAQRLSQKPTTQLITDAKTVPTYLIPPT